MCGRPVRLLGFLPAWWLGADGSILKAEVEAAISLDLDPEMGRESHLAKESQSLYSGNGA